MTRLVAIVAILVTCAACEREQRRFSEASPASGIPQTLKMGQLEPVGSPQQVTIQSEYDENAWAISEGKRNYEWFNCVGCHSHGGGGMGPPLMDSRWIYGSEPENIFATIMQGRPNGMPAFMGKVPDHQIWELAAYVRSMSGLAPPAASGGRNDDMQGPPPENSIDAKPPKNTRVPS